MCVRVTSPDAQISPTRRSRGACSFTVAFGTVTRDAGSHGFQRTTMRGGTRKSKRTGNEINEKRRACSRLASASR